MNPLHNLSSGLRSMAAAFTVIILAGPICAQEITVSSENNNNIQNNATETMGSIGLGAVAGTSTVSNFTLANTGTSSLNLGQITLSASNHFSIDAANNPSDAAIAAGSNRILSIRFSPQSFGTHTAFVTIPNNDPDESPFTLNLSGQANAPQLGVEQPSGTQLSQPQEVTVPSVPTNTSSPLDFVIRNSGDRELTWDASISGPDLSS
ncbi:MAG: choice-of-anchor D domain-containing protein, partial [Verrucomicrobiota bacterium]|nr:choice-of-anchor D domain-containing protein [Verrucomicrobiota bacterium]